MKGSLIVIVFFCVGCIMGAFNKFEFDTHTVSMYILYALMLQVGISIGSNKNLKAIVSHLHPKMLLIPLGTIIGTLLFSPWQVCYCVNGACSTVWQWEVDLPTIHSLPSLSPSSKNPPLDCNWLRNWEPLPY